MTLIKCNELLLGYDKKQIAPPITLEVHEGDFVAITGENGAGKSTLVKTLLGLTAPLSGSVSFGEGITHRDIGYLPQSAFIPRDFPATVYEVVLSGCIGKTGIIPFYSKAHKNKARESMHRLGIWDMRDRSFSELSGGQAQRVLLCRALCATGKLLLLDEPVQGLDPAATHEMYDAVATLNREGIAVLMVSHDICTTLGYATRILHLGRDEIFLGSTHDYRTSAVGHEFIFAHGGICDCDEHNHGAGHGHGAAHDHQNDNGEVRA